MPTFKAGWYVVATDQTTGRITCRYFSTARLVTAECHLLDGKQILHWTTLSKGHEAGLPATWNASYRFIATETEGDGWDNPRAPKAPAPRVASSPCDDLNNKCALCDRRGLLILPALYAVGRADVAADNLPPPLTAPFGDGLSEHSLPPALARYTLRTVRPGFLYVYNAVQGAAGWKGYQVNENGYLFEFDLHAKAPPAGPPPGNPCGRRVNSPVARCIAIPDAQHVGQIHLAFTDTAWTAATLKAHRENAGGCRDRMRRFDAGAWVKAKGRAPQPHVAGAVGRLRDVAEFALSWSLGANPVPVAAADATRVAPPPRPGEPGGNAGPSPAAAFRPLFQLAFADSLSAFRPIGNEAAATAAAMARAGDGIEPALVALDDPAGIAADLNQQVFRRVTAWYEQPDRKWKRESAHTIESLREAVKHGAVEDQRDTNQAVGGVLLTIMPAHAGPFMRGGSLAEKYGNLRYMSEEQQDLVGERAWQSDHVHLYRRPELEGYLERTFPAELQAFESAVVKPLDLAFTGWLTGHELADHFTHDFDRADADSGEAYALKMSIVLQDACARRGVWDVVSRQLAADPASHKNIVLRSLFLNQDVVIDGLVAAVAHDGSGDAMQLDPFKWDKISEKTWALFRKIAKTDHAKAPVLSGKAMDSAMNALARVTHQVSGPILHKLGTVFDQVAAWTVSKLPERRLIGVLGALAKAENPQMRLISMTALSTRKAATRQVADAIAQFSRQPGQQYRSAVRTVLDKYEEASGQRYAFNAIALVDGREAESLKDYAASTLAGRRNELVTGAVLRMERTEQVLAANLGKMFSREVKIGLVSSVLLALTLRSAHHEMVKAGSTEKTQKVWAFAAGVAALSGLTVELAGKMMEALPWGAAKYAQPLKFLQNTLKTRGAVLGFGGKMLGVVGSFISGVLAIVDGLQSRGVSPVYAGIMISLGVVSIIGAILTVIGIAGPWGVLVAVVVAVIYMIVGFFKPTKIQKWLNASFWGNHAGGKRYGTHEEENEALHDLAKA